jgi:predicted O-methyltransferase YrrM
MQHTRQSPAVVQRRVKQIENCWRDFKANAAAATEAKSSSAPTPAPFDMRSLYGEHDVYANLTLRSIDLGGWQAHPCLYLKLVEQVRPRLIVEVGVWKGSTTLIFAEALRHYRSVWRGKVVAVDTWLGALEFWKKSKHDATRDLKFVNGYPSVYYNFLSNVVHQGLQDQVVPFPSPSLMAAQYFRVMKPPVSIDILHLDGSHEYEDVAADLAAWWPVIRKGGVMIGDDYHRGWPGVIRAVDEFKIREHVNVSFNELKWTVTKPI